MSRTAVINNKFIPSDFLPIGFLGYLPYSAVPAGWLVCDGTVYNVADYLELAAKLGSAYGGDGVTTFAVPDDRGIFRRGLDLSKGYDSGRALGSEQGDAFQGHGHQVSRNANAGCYQTNQLTAAGSYGGPPTDGMPQAQTYSIISDGSSGTPRTGTETRPKNRAYVPVIKAKNIYYDMTIQGGNAASLGGNPANYYAANSLTAKYTDFTGSFTASGYRRMPDGTILQWGASPSSASQTITFPTAFSVACYSIVASPISPVSALFAVTGNVTNAQFLLNTWDANPAAYACPCYWQAIGK